MLHLSKKQTQTFQYVWLLPDGATNKKTYRWGKNEHVLSDKNNNAKTKHKNKKAKKPHFNVLKNC